MIAIRNFFLFLLIQFWKLNGVKIEIDTQIKIDELFKFWDSTGFCPPDPHQLMNKYVLSSDMKQNLALIGSLPNQGLRQVRVHWLLDLIQFNFINNTIGYNFDHLDEFINLLYSYELKPGFEIMGNPSNYFQNFENQQQLKEWEKLISTMVLRYTTIYGQKYISNWNFELWNEPDHNYFDGINFTLSSYLQYFKATWKGLQKSGIKNFKLGGPADKCLPILSKKHSQFCWSFLKFVNYTRNNFPLDFISIHEKGEKDNLMTILKKEQEVIGEIDSNYQNLKNVSIFNDESDLLKIWSEPKEWRADSTYASLTAINILEHIRVYFNSSSRLNQRLKLISHDNAFLSFYPHQFTQRTLLARFQMNNTQPNYTQFIRKPIYGVLGLFGLLGNTIIKSKISKNNQSTIRVIATKEKLQSNNESQTAFIILFSNGQTSVNNVLSSVNVTLKMKIFENKFKLFRWTRYIIDNVHTNPYLVWKKNNCPDFPSYQLFDKMREVEGPLPIEFGDVPANQSFWRLNFKLNFPSISLLIVCSKSKNFQEKVNNVRLINVTQNNILILWKSVRNKCLKTYQIEYSKTGQKDDFVTINKWKVIFPSFQYTSINKSIHGYYRVVPIDLWNKFGISSDLVKI